MALNPGALLQNGHYRILRLLGRGGFGFVYHAQDALLGEQVAIKELIPALVGDEAMLKRFLAEARATMRLTHRHIVRTHNVFQEGENFYIVMEYMAGGSLEERLRQFGHLPVAEAVRVAAEVCAGLACAHEERVVHCDLKPANILFDAAGRAKVADFGIAHVSGEMLTRSWHTPSGFVAGTLPYMSPEQTDGVRDEPRIDLYALGAVLYRALTGHTYLDFETQETPRAQAQNVERIYSAQPVAPGRYNRGVPGWLDAVVLKALAKRPEARFPSAEAMRAALLQQPLPKAPPLPLPATREIPDRQTPGSLYPPARPVPPAAVGRSAPQVRRKAALPVWFWPALGASMALLVFLILAIASLIDGRDGRAVAGPVAATEPTATETAVAAPIPTLTPGPAAVATGTSASTVAPTSTPRPTVARAAASRPTDTPAPTATRTATRTAVPPTRTPPPTATPVPPTRTPAPTATPVPPSATPRPVCSIQPGWPFDALGSVPELGCATGPSTSTHFSHQLFEGGQMIYRGDVRQIYVLYHSDNTWQAFPDTYVEGEPWQLVEYTPPPGLQQPIKGFDRVWENYPQAVRDRVGWALRDEVGLIGGNYQAFERGTALWLSHPGYLEAYFLLFSDGTWAQK